MKKENHEIIPIFFATDDNYAKFLVVALKSIIENASKNYTYRIYVLHTNLSEKYQSIISNYANDNFEISFVDVSETLKEFVSLLYTRDYYTNTTYYRFFIATMFKEYDKALYLDSDIIVQGDISKLYHTNLKNNLVGAIQEEVMHINKDFKNYPNLVLNVRVEKYFNAGVLVMNLKEFRDRDVYHLFLDMLKLRKFEVAQDQDYLNVICKDRVTYLSYAWNKTPLNHPLYNEKNVKLVHYKITWKPWNYEGILFEKLFWKYAKMTCFYDELLLMRDSYSVESKAKDELGYKNLVKLARRENARAAKEINERNQYENEIFVLKQARGY